jgi:hypothetical protein
LASDGSLDTELGGLTAGTSALGTELSGSRLGLCALLLLVSGRLLSLSSLLVPLGWGLLGGLLLCRRLSGGRLLSAGLRRLLSTRLRLLAARRSGLLSLPSSVRIVSLIAHGCRRSRSGGDRPPRGTTKRQIKPEAGTRFPAILALRS